MYFGALLGNIKGEMKIENLLQSVKPIPPTILLHKFCELLLNLQDIFLFEYPCRMVRVSGFNLAGF